MSTTQFTVLKVAVQEAFDRIKHLPLFASNATKDDLWNTYLDKLTSLGHNEIYRERGEHDCQCCKHFIRRIGNIVALREGRLVSIWDHIETGTYYDELAKAMDELVSNAGIRGIFLNDMDHVGTDSNVELRDDGSTHTWEHFYLELPAELVEPNGETRRRKIGAAGDYFGSLKLSMEQLNIDSVQTVIDLVNANNLYRGTEHLSTLKLMKELLNEYSSQPEKTHWLWLKSRELGSRSTVRSTVIGTLVRDLSSGMDLEQAVKSFESKVAPHNYKRSKALITPGMVKAAETKVQELGIEESLARRPAVLTDITVNNVLFADKQATNAMDGILGDLKKEAQDNIQFDPKKAQDITVLDFINKVVPKSTSIEAFVQGRHSANQMTLVAPQNPDAPSILKWGNNFTWTYNGDTTDADIKERVAKAGGNVKGALRISLAWDCSDDLDLHLNCPKNGHVYFGSRKGMLDVDMNAVGRHNSVDPVENITYATDQGIPKGKLMRVVVDQYDRRGGATKGFTVEIEYNGVIHQLEYTGVLRGECTFSFTVNNGEVVLSNTPSELKVSKGGSAGTFKRVSAIMHSPNHWDDNSVGNKHTFFMLDDLEQPDAVRGFYNEYLSDELRENRKVFEVLGDRMKAQPVADQLNGVGFSETVRNTIIVKADGRPYNIKF